MSSGTTAVFSLDSSPSSAAVYRIQPRSRIVFSSREGGRGEEHSVHDLVGDDKARQAG
jgi:hypothetical protein